MPETTQRRNVSDRENGNLNIRELKEMNISSLTDLAKDLNVPGYRFRGSI